MGAKTGLRRRIEKKLDVEILKIKTETLLIGDVETYHQLPCNWPGKALLRGELKYSWKGGDRGASGELESSKAETGWEDKRQDQRVRGEVDLLHESNKT